MLGAGAGNARGIGLLERVVADQAGRHLPGDADDGNTVHQGIGQPGHRVGRARSRGYEDHADLSGRPRVALRGMDGSLLVTGQDVPDPVLAVNRIEQRNDRSSGIAENRVDLLVAK